MKDNCQRARSHMASLESGQRVASTNDKGEREILDDNQRAARWPARATSSAATANKRPVYIGAVNQASCLTPRLSGAPTTSAAEATPNIRLAAAP